MRSRRCAAVTATCTRLRKISWASPLLGGASAALAYTGEGFGDLRDAILEVGVSSWPLLIIPRSSRSTAEAPPAEVIGRNWAVVCASAFVYVIFAATLGRGLRF
jgi:hypothetical protein